MADEKPPEAPCERQLRLRLVGLSFLMLFLELALVRWTDDYDIHLADLTNFVLLASFLGIGIGCVLYALAFMLTPRPAAPA